MVGRGGMGRVGACGGGGGDGDGGNCDGVYIYNSMEVITNHALISDDYVSTNDSNLRYLHVQSQKSITRHLMVAYNRLDFFVSWSI